jgi:hypothetical protein
MPDHDEGFPMPPADWDDDEAFEGIVAKWKHVILHEAGHVVVSHSRGGQPSAIMIARVRPGTDLSGAGSDISDGQQQANGAIEVGLARNAALTDTSPVSHRIDTLVAGQMAERLFDNYVKEDAASRDRQMAEDVASQQLQQDDQEVTVESLIDASEDRVRTLLQENETFVHQIVEAGERALRANRVLLESLYFGPLDIVSNDDLKGILRR